MTKIKKYCCFTTNCKNKGLSDITSYICCNDCTNKTCDVRCKDCYEKCKYANTEQEAQEIIDRWNKPFVSSTPVKEVKKKKVEPTPEELLAQRQQQIKEQAQKQSVTTVPHDIGQLAKLLDVKRDKVGYLIKVKQMSFEDVYNKLKGDK